jgi:sRNA-binding protein
MSTLSLNPTARRKAESRLGIKTVQDATVQPKQLSPEQAKRERLAAVTAFQMRLAANWPEIFCAPGQLPRVALAIGISREIAQQCSDVSVRTRRVFFRRYTRSAAYLAILKSGAPRIGLDGAIAGRVTDAEAQYAAEKLQQMARAASAPEGE